MRAFVQRAGDRETGGVMASRRCMVNGPARVHRKSALRMSRLERLPPLAGQDIGEIPYLLRNLFYRVAYMSILPLYGVRWIFLWNKLKPRVAQRKPFRPCMDYLDSCRSGMVYFFGKR